MAKRESNSNALKRFGVLNEIQQTYPEFDAFFEDGLKEVFGFDATPIQLDICQFVQYGNLSRMVQAQRGQAKTTIAMFYAVWRLVHDPSTRILVVCAGGKLASDITGGVLQILRSWDILECLLPDASAGDRTSSLKFDVHHSLRLPDKTASVTATSTTSQIQGLRADLLIGDDIESSLNSLTTALRSKLKVAMNNFSDICTTGDILFLGTPQSTKSVYNKLHTTGTEVRIYPARIPSDEQLSKYHYLADIVIDMMQSKKSTGFGCYGDLGEPVDPLICDEEALRKREKSQGRAHFELQYMLDATLSDSDRTPLRTEDLIITKQRFETALPADLAHSDAPYNRVDLEALQLSSDLELYYAQNSNDGSLESSLQTYHEKIMYIDPSGRGTDETSAVIVGRLHSKIHIIAVMSASEGYQETTLSMIQRAYAKYRPNRVYVEANMGDGMFTTILKNYFTTHKFDMPHFENVKVHSNKERRIISTLEPLLSRHAISIPIHVVKEDLAKNTEYSLLHQLSSIMNVRNCLAHDDRLDALEGAISRLNSDALATSNDSKDTVNKDFVAMIKELKDGSSKKSKKSKRRVGKMGQRRIVNRKY